MELADFIHLGDREPRLRFLVIGGWAVGAHGHTRPTFDVDFCVRRADHEAWLMKAESAGLKLYRESGSFIQFTQPDGGDGFDLMYANETTFDGLWKDSVPVDFNGAAARVPSLDHLLAMKLHVLKLALPHRTAKDAEDVELLARHNQLDLTQPHYEQLFLKHANREIYDTILRILRHP